MWIIERLREIIAGFFGVPQLSPEERQKLLEKRAGELELRAEWLEKEAVVRKRIATAKLRMKKVGGGRGSRQGWLLLIMVVVVALVILITQSC